MKKAFTLIELIFVIVIIGILASIALPKLNKNDLSKAAIQVATHIRYTQHLAMVDDKFNASDNQWYKDRWQLQFNKTIDTIDVWAYTIYNDITRSGNANGVSEIAINPNNRKKYMTGGASGFIDLDDNRRTRVMALQETYGIKDIKFSNCGSTAKRISFDNLGRPLNGSPSTADNPVERIITTQCKIELCTVIDCDIANSDEAISILIEPETGYVKIL